MDFAEQDSLGKGEEGEHSGGKENVEDDVAYHNATMADHIGRKKKVRFCGFAFFFYRDGPGSGRGKRSDRSGINWVEDGEHCELMFKTTIIDN